MDFCRKKPKKPKKSRLKETCNFTMIFRHRKKYTHQTARMEGSVEQRLVAVKTSVGSATFKERSKKVPTGKRQKFLPVYAVWKKLKALNLILIL